MKLWLWIYQGQDKCKLYMNIARIKTGFVSRANMGHAANTQSGLMAAKTVVMAGCKAMMAGKLNTIRGWKN